MQNYEIEVKSFGKVLPKTGNNKRTLYEHQRMALENLNLINQNSDYSTLLVLPTGGGKT
jgi:superfamily II DNA or RNA helicase